MEAVMSNSVFFGLVLSSLALGAKGACTITNVALGKPAEQTSTYTDDYDFVCMAKYAVDGNTDADRLSMVEITVSPDSSFVEGKLFAYIGGEVGNAMTVYPDTDPMSGQWVKITLKKIEVLTLCEVEVFARKKIRKMSFVHGQGGTGREQHIKTVPLMTLVQAIVDCRKCDEENFVITVHETYMEYDCAA